MPRKKRAIVLSGGGAKGCFQLGVLDYLREIGEIYNFDIICGTSVGTLNAVMLAQEDYPKLKDLWFGLKGNSDIYYGLPVLRFLFSGMSLYSNNPLMKLIDKYVDYQKLIQVLNNGQKTLKIGVVSLQTGQVFYINPLENKLGTCSKSITQERFKKFILASTSIPVMFPAQGVDKKEFYHWLPFADGGLRDITPLKAAIDAGAETILVVLASPRGMRDDRKKFKIKNALLRTIDILTNEIYNQDIDNCKWYNEHLADDGVHRKINLTIIEPKDWDAIPDTLEFDPKMIRSGYEHGKKMAWKKRIYLEYLDLTDEELVDVHIHDFIPFMSKAEAAGGIGCNCGLRIDYSCEHAGSVARDECLAEILKRNHRELAREAIKFMPRA